MPARLSLEGFEEPELLDESPGSLLWRARGPDGPVLIRVYPAPSRPESEGQCLRQGCRLLEGLEHPAIPRPLSWAESPDGLHLVFADPGSWTLRDHLRDQPMDPLEAAETVLQIAEALHVAHCAGLFHGNLGPDTIRIVPETGRILLLGLEAGYPDPGSSLDGTADLRALGGLLAFLLTAQDPPPEGPALRRECPELPCDLEWIASRLRRAGTPQGARSAGETALELDSWLDGTLAPPSSRSACPPPDLAGLWAEVETGPARSPEEPLRLRWLFPVLLGLLTWLGWLLAPSWRTPEAAGPPPDEVVFSAPGEEVAEPLHPGYGFLALEVQGLRPPDTPVRLKVREGDQVIRETELPAGRGQVEIPKGRLLTLEIAADLHSTRTRSILLEPTRVRATLRTVLVRHTEVTVSTVPGAAIHLDRRPIGQADQKGILMLPPGTLEVGRVCMLSASKVGYEPREESFTVKTGHTVILMDLAPLKNARRRTGPEPPSGSPLLPSGPALEAPSPGSPSVPGPPPSSPARTPQAPPTMRPSPATPEAPTFPQIPPAPARRPPSPPKAPVAPPEPPATDAVTPAPAPSPASTTPPSSGGSALPVLLPDN